MRNKTLLALGICLLLYLPTQAQTDTTAPKRYKWEVATDLLWLINKNNIPASSIFVRRHFVTKKGKNVALRMRLGWDFDYYKQTSYFFDRQVSPQTLTNIVAETKKYAISPFLIVGYQKSTLYKKYEIFYGIDVMLKYWAGEEETIMVAPPSNPIGSLMILRTTINKGASVGVQPIIGLKYYLNDRFSLSTEVSLGGSFSKDSYLITEVEYPIDLSARGGYGDGDKYSFKFNVSPFYLFNLSYNF